MTVMRRLLSFSTSHPHTVSITNKVAFSRLYDETHIAVYRYVFGLIGGNQHDAEDITAETYLKAWHARKRFKGGWNDTTGWLFTIAKRIVIDRYRKQRVRPPIMELDQQFIAAPDFSPEERAILNEQLQVLWQLLGELSDENREMLVLRYMLGWRVKQIAEHLNLNENTVSVRLRRTLAELQSHWSVYELKRG